MCDKPRHCTVETGRVLISAIMLSVPAGLSRSFKNACDDAVNTKRALIFAAKLYWLNLHSDAKAQGETRSVRPKKCTVLLLHLRIATCSTQSPDPGGESKCAHITLMNSVQYGCRQTQLATRKY